VSLIVNHEEHLPSALADTGANNTGANSSIILEAYTSAPFIKTDESNITTWSTMVVNLLQLKLGYSCNLFTTKVQSQDINVSFLGISCEWPL
jgi:hypothetical protein